ncbi:MAG: F0F1 ATP synthase subunit delta, partial [Planctomycetes bacterium]|nr:F0F1 ATP synthase subunit delta [Planctomycetota bacterium]
ARARLAEELARHMRAEVVLDSRVDPAIVGGMIIRCGDKVVDGSVKERLAVLKRRLMAQPVGSDYCHENQS